MAAKGAFRRTREEMQAEAARATSTPAEQARSTADGDGGTVAGQVNATTGAIEAAGQFDWTSWGAPFRWA